MALSRAADNDILVLGGGLMGTASAFFLARRGFRVCLVEKRAIGAGATVGSFGNIRRSGRHLAQMPLAHRSLALWNRAEALLGRDVEFRATGHLRLIFDAFGLAAMRAFAEEAAPAGLMLEELTPAQIRARFPGLGPEAIAASFSPDDGSGNPRLIGPAFAEAASRLGAQIIDHAGTPEITHGQAGFEIRTAKGIFAAPRLLNCAGAWGAKIARQFGEEVPLEAWGPQMAVTEPLPYRVSPVVGVWAKEHGAYLRQVERGNIVIGGAVPRMPVALDPGFAQINPHRFPEQLRAALRLLPALEDIAIIRQWSGCEGYIADALPVMGRSATTEGLFHAFGFCGHGFQLGPGVGDAMAELIATGACETPLEAMSIGRFRAAQQDGRYLP